MAFASSKIEEQEVIIKPCDLCEDEEDVNWFCKNCFQNLCDRCKRMHPKIVSFKDHQLVSILEGVAIIKENISNLCHDHNEPFSFYCRQCENNACSKCLSLVHRKHDVIDIHHFNLEVQDKLQEILTEKENEHEQIKKKVDALDEYEDECKKKITESFVTIDERRKAIRQALDEECEDMKQMIKTTTDQRLNEAKESKIKAQDRHNTYEETIQRVKQLLKLQTAASMNKFVQASVVEIQSLKPLSYPIPRKRTFNVGIIDKESLCNMIGKFVDKDDAYGKSEKPENGENVVLQHMKIVREYTLDLRDELFCFCTSPAGGIWIGGRHNVYRMSSDCSTVILKIPVREDRTYPITPHCCSIACLQSGDAIVSYNFFPYIDIFTSGERRNEFKCLYSMRQHNGIVVSNQDEVVISFGEKTRRRHYVYLKIFSNEGEELKRIAVTKTLVNFCIDQNGNFIISDRESLCLTIIDRDGAVLKEIQTMAHGLRQLRCDKFGNILGVLDDRKTVCLTSGDGKIKRSFTTLSDDDKRIQDICIGRDSNLLILMDRKVIVDKYLE